LTCDRSLDPPLFNQHLNDPPPVFFIFVCWKNEPPGACIEDLGGWSWAFLGGQDFPSNLSARLTRQTSARRFFAVYFSPCGGAKMSHRPLISPDFFNTPRWTQFELLPSPFFLNFDRTSFTMALPPTPKHDTNLPGCSNAQWCDCPLEQIAAFSSPFPLESGPTTS